MLVPVKTQSGFLGVDILLTSVWPAEVWKHAHNTPSTEIQGSPLISRLAAGLKPRYHFAGMGVHYERQPYRYFFSSYRESNDFYRNHRVLLEPAQHPTRFIGLAAMDNKEKQKWLYAFNLQVLFPTILLLDSLAYEKALPGGAHTSTTECLRISIYGDNYRNISQVTFIRIVYVYLI